MGKRGGMGRSVDRFLTGESGRPVDVVVERVRKTTELVVKHNLDTKGDFGPVDFFMPLVLFGVVFVLGMIPPFIGLALAVQILLVFDLVKRVRRRPSGLRVTGLVPPYRNTNWLWALLVYLAALPFMLAAGWLNRFLVALVYSPPDPFARYAASLYGPGLAGVIAVGLGVLLFIFFQTVVFAPITEEIWFRGIGLAGFLQHNKSRVRSVLWTSLIFGALHGSTRILDATLFGMVASLIRFRTGSTYCCIAVHMLHNFSVTVIALYLSLTSGF